MPLPSHIYAFQYHTHDKACVSLISMASGPITSWQIDEETVADFIILGSKITADGDCSHKIKRHLLLGREVMTNLESI